MATSSANRRWRIVFMGTPEFAVPSLEALLDSGETVVAAVSQPDRAAGRGRRVAPTPVKAVALAHGLPVIQPATLREPAVHRELERFAPDLIVVAAYGNLLPRAVLDLPRHGCINVHASLLPRHRGAAPVQWALLVGDTVTGVTIMQMNEAMDAGDILLQKTVSIESIDTGATLGARLASVGAAALTEAMRGLKAGTLKAHPQDSSKATLAPRIKKEMGRIDWAETAAQLERKVRALQPWPTAYTDYQSRQLKVLAARVDDPQPSGGGGPVPGTVMASTAAGLRVATGSGTLILDVLQLEGRRALPAADFLRGHPVAVGTVLGA